MIELLLWAAPLGLLIDIGGFLLVIRYGHTLFMRVGTEAIDSEGKDGDVFIVIPGLPGDSGDRRRRRWAHMGVCVVVAGFGLQIVGAIAAIYLTV